MVRWGQWKRNRVLSAQPSLEWIGWTNQKMLHTSASCCMKSVDSLVLSLNVAQKKYLKIQPHQPSGVLHACDN
jgi:hypothetical protein